MTRWYSQSVWIICWSLAGWITEGLLYASCHMYWYHFFASWWTKLLKCVSVCAQCVLVHGVVHVRGTDVHAAHRAARGRRIPSCRSWRSWGWTPAAGWSVAPSPRTDRTPPWRCCGPNTSHAFATLPDGSGTTPGRIWENTKTSKHNETKRAQTPPDTQLYLVIHTHTHTHTHTELYTHTRTHTQLYTHTELYTHTHRVIYTHTHIHILSQHRYIHTHTYTHSYTHI